MRRAEVELAVTPALSELKVIAIYGKIGSKKTRWLVH